MKEIRPFCTVGSKEQRQSRWLLPACWRYLGEHVRAAKKHAGRHPLYFLSSEHGLIKARTRIAHYEHELVPGGVGELAALVARQVAAEEMSMLFYFRDPSQDWTLYTEALVVGARMGGAEVVHMPLPPLKAVAQPLPQRAIVPVQAWQK